MKTLFLDGNITLDEALPNKKFKIHGIGIHGDIVTLHPGETYDKRQYIMDRVKKAAPSLVGRWILLDHDEKTPLEGCRVTLSRWNEKENGLYYEGEVTEVVANMIKNGEIKGVSISVNPWIKGGGVEWVDGYAPFGFEYDELSLIKNMTPADPQAWVQLMESLEKRFEILPDHLKQARLREPPKTVPWDESKWQKQVAAYKQAQVEEEVKLRRKREEETPLEKFRRRTER